MAKYAAIAVCLAFIVYLFRTDLKRPDGPTHAIWVPLIWMFLAGSRYVSSWLGLTPGMTDASQYSDGSPVDRLVFLGLIIAGIVILARREIDWARIAHLNTIIVLYLLYCLSSAAWSEEPSILVRRWIKDLGTPIMALVVLTEPRPYEALAALLRRFTFLVLPLSFLFVRYLPDLAREYRPDGSPMFTGIGHQKNHLGMMCLIAGIYLLWDSVRRRTDGVPTFARKHLVLTGVLALMLVWLIRLADSKTSLVCLLIACAVILVGRLMGRNPGLMVGTIVGGSLLIGAAEYMFELKDSLLIALGRNPSLTNRTEVWDIILKHAQNPIVGSGFMSFWTGDRMAAIWAEVGVVILQAHSGYVEQYVNLGYIGLLFIALIMAGALFKIVAHMPEDRDAAALRFAIVMAAALYNVTEASFYGMNNMWLLLMIACLEGPRAGRLPVAVTARDTTSAAPAMVPAAGKLLATRSAGIQGAVLQRAAGRGPLMRSQPAAAASTPRGPLARRAGERPRRKPPV